MRGIVTMKKLNEANNWLANVKTNEKELRFIMGKKSTSVCVNFYLRAEKIYSKFKNIIKNSEEEILKQGWDIGCSRMSYSSEEIFVTATASEEVSFIELKFRFYIFRDALEEINNRIKFIKETLEFFTKSISEVKISMDIQYYVENTFNVSESSLKDEITSLKYEKKMNEKNSFRKFEIINRHNVTSEINLKQNNKYTDTGIGVNIENIVIEEENLTQEIQFSLYYYIIEYYKIHYNIVNSKQPEYIKSHNEFYNKINLKI